MDRCPSSWGDNLDGMYFLLPSIGSLLTTMCPPDNTASEKFYIGQYNTNSSSSELASSENFAFTSTSAPYFVDMLMAQLLAAQGNGNPLRLREQGLSS